MSLFDEAMQREQEKQRAQQSEKQAYEDTNRRYAEQAVPIIKQSLIELAAYLTKNNAPSFEYVHVLKTSKLVPAKKYRSPRGYVLDFGTGLYRGETFKGRLTSLRLLTPDGRIWEHDTPRYTSEPPKQGYVDITVQNLQGMKIKIQDYVLTYPNPRGSNGVKMGDPYTTVGYDREPILITDHLATLARSMKLPTWNPELQN
jgi:hypothetical protein